MKNIIVTTILICSSFAYAQTDQPRADLSAAFTEAFAHPENPNLTPVLRELWMLGRSLSWLSIENQQKVGQSTVQGAVRDAIAREAPLTEERAREMTMVYLEIADQFNLEQDRRLAPVAAPIIARDRLRHHRFAGAAIGFGAMVMAGGYLVGFPMVGLLGLPVTGMATMIFLRGFFRDDDDVTSLVRPHLQGCEGMFLAQRLRAGESLHSIVDQ